MSTSSQSFSKKHHLSQITFGIFIIIAVTHVVLTNIPGHYYNITKVFLMPSLCAFFLVTVKDLKKGWYIPWALCGLWLGNICLIWGEQSKVLFILGSAFTIIGFFGYIWILMRPVKGMSVWFIFLQMPVIWACAFFVIFMKDDLGHMLAPISLYMTLIAIISISGLALLLTALRSPGTWLMFTGTLFYIAENGLYTADHYMPDYSFGPNIVHTCFIMAQTLIACGYLLRERENLE